MTQEATANNLPTLTSVQLTGVNTMCPTLGAVIDRLPIDCSPENRVEAEKLLLALIQLLPCSPDIHSNTIQNQLWNLTTARIDELSDVIYQTRPAFSQKERESLHQVLLPHIDNRVVFGFGLEAIRMLEIIVHNSRKLYLVD